MSCYIQSTNIPYLYCRNGIYYYRKQSTWKPLRTRCKRTAFKKLIDVLSGSLHVTGLVISNGDVASVVITEVIATVINTWVTITGIPEDEKPD